MSSLNAFVVALVLVASGCTEPTEIEILPAHHGAAEAIDIGPDGAPDLGPAIVRPSIPPTCPDCPTPIVDGGALP